jgi:uncharacterized alpha-E superfamily protein
MLSRVADSLYWMSRYLERAEHSARLIDVNLSLMLDYAPGSADARWRRVMACLGVPVPLGMENDAHHLLHTITFDTGTRMSIVSSIMAARENARQVREQISSEMWEQLNRLFHAVKRTTMDELWESSPHEFLSAAKEGSHLFQGITDSTMTHGEGWQFIQVGRFMERAAAVATLLDVHFGDSLAITDFQEQLEWIGLLKSCTAFEPFCRTYTADLKPQRVADFLLLNPEFPHSVAFSAAQIDQALRAISSASGTQKGQRVERIAGKLRASLRFGQIDELINAGLHGFLADIQRQCALIHHELHQVYITYPIQTALGA